MGLWVEDRRKNERDLRGSEVSQPESERKARAYMYKTFRLEKPSPVEGTPRMSGMERWIAQK